MKNKTPLAVRRAALPQVMFPDDVGVVLQIDAEDARLAMLRGECGPFLQWGAHVAVLREAFLASLSERQVVPAHSAGGAPRG